MGTVLQLCVSAEPMNHSEPVNSETNRSQLGETVQVGLGCEL